MNSNFFDAPPTQQHWLHELAQEELNPNSFNPVKQSSSFKPQQLVEESTIDFLTELRQHFCQFCQLFNPYSDQGSRFQEIKVYTLTQTLADFMLFRNQVKLIFSNTAHGIIEIRMTRHQHSGLNVDGQIYHSKTARKQPEEDAKEQELLAQLGPFHEVFWTFQGEKVSPSQVAKFHFIEFVKLTRLADPSKTRNHLLLEKIKTLLEEKGVQL